MAERVRIEHTSTRKRADNGFEDREGHQAPITLRNARTVVCRSEIANSKLSYVIVMENSGDLALTAEPMI